MFRWVYRKALLIGVNVAVLALLLEASALAYFLLRDGHLYYSAREEIVKNRAAEMATGLIGAAPDELRRRLREGLSKIKYRLNPYYGFQYIANSRVPVEAFHVPRAEAAANCKYRVNVLCENGEVYFVTNNYGFDSVLNYPYREQSDDEFVIGIFGGSVALGFVKSTMPGLFDDIFARAPQLRGRKVTLLSFARESYKQPQQLETLAYFLSIGQRFDLIVNIDGFNELLDAQVNYNANVDYSMPAAAMITTMTDLFDAALQETGNEASLNVYFWRSVRQRILRRMAAVPLAGPASLLDLGFGIAGGFEAGAQSAARGPSNGPVLDRPLYMLPQTAGTTLDHAFVQSISEWAQSSLLMARMLHGLGIPYLHVLQPNQYFSEKAFTEEEKRVAISWGNGYATHVHEFYPRLLEEGKKLSAEGVDFVSAVGIFDNVSETIYADECCHFNAAGNLLLGQFIAEHIPVSP